jgi:hypothetical protein
MNISFFEDATDSDCQSHAICVGEFLYLFMSPKNFIDT